MTHGGRLRGVFPVLAVPFDEGGALDRPSLSREVAWAVAQGADGLVIFGLASESYKLSDDERSLALATVMEAASGRLPVVVGVDHTGGDPAAARAVEAHRAGASALMALPPYLVKPDDDGLLAFFGRLAAAAPLPIVVQDAMPTTGVPLSVPFLERLHGELGPAMAVKIETPPTGPKMTALLRRLPDLVIFSGSGGLHSFDELSRGASGLMIGPLEIRLFKDMLAAMASGATPRAEEMYRDRLPLLLLATSTLDTFIAYQKAGLARRGVIASGRCRLPHQPPDEHQLRLLASWGGEEADAL